MEVEFIYYARLECVSKLDESEFAGSRTIGILGSNYRGRRLGRSTIFMQSRIYGWRAISARSSPPLVYSSAGSTIEAAGGCCQWQHLVKGRKGEILRGERRSETGEADRRKKAKGRKKWRRKKKTETRLQEVANAPRVTAVAQQYNPITLSCNPTSPLPPPRRRGSSRYPRLHHCSFPRSFPPTLPPPSHHLFSGLREPYPR